MTFQEAGGYCKQCGKPVLVRRKGTNHVLHLLLSIVTGGLWLIVWLLCAIKIERATFKRFKRYTDTA